MLKMLDLWQSGFVFVAVVNLEKWSISFGRQLSDTSCRGQVLRLEEKHSTASIMPGYRCLALEHEVLNVSHLAIASLGGKEKKIQRVQISRQVCRPS